MVAQTRKVLFMCNWCSTNRVIPWNTRTATVAQQVAQRRQSGCRTIAMVAQKLPWSPNGGIVVTTAIAQWTLLVGQRRQNGTREAEASLKLVHNVYNSTHFLRGDQWPTSLHSFCDDDDACAFLLPPWSDLWATDVLRNLCATVLNVIKTSRRPLRPWRSLNVLSATLERPGQDFGLLLLSTATWPVLWSHKEGTKVTVLCKGSIRHKW